MRSKTILASGLALGVVACASCSLFQTEAAYEPVIDPGNFVSVIDNPFMPLISGTRTRFRKSGDEGVEDMVVMVMPETKVIDGVTTRVVHDVAYQGGQVKEDTWDWYAQDRAGNVWYFGEDTKAYEKGRIDTSG